MTSKTKPAHSRPKRADMLGDALRENLKRRRLQVRQRDAEPVQAANGEPEQLPQRVVAMNKLPHLD